MNIRQEVEVALSSFAAENSLPVAYEGVPFTPPTDGSFLEIIFLDPEPTLHTVDATRTRVWGTFQINCYVLDGKGVGELDELTASIVAMFPVFDKLRYETFSVEQPPKVSGSIPDGIHRVSAVRVKYRQEL